MMQAIPGADPVGVTRLTSGGTVATGMSHLASGDAAAATGVGRLAPGDAAATSVARVLTVVAQRGG